MIRNKDKDVEIFECFGDRVTVDIKKKSDKLHFFIHDKGGWIFDTKNIVVALYILKDKAIKDLKSNSMDDTKIIDILNSKIEYDKELIEDSLKDGGDLQWVSWLTQGVFDYGNDKEFIYSVVLEDFLEEGYDYDKEEDSDIIDNAYWNTLEHYSDDSILEQIKNDYESELKDIINKSPNYIELAEGVSELSNEIKSNVYGYLLDFIQNNKAY